jgi:hypothetical protein
MDFVDNVPRFHAVCLAGAGATPTPVYATNRPIWAKDDGATGEGVFVVRVSDRNAGNIRDTIIHIHNSCPFGEKRPDL